MMNECWYVAAARKDGGTPKPAKALGDKLYFVRSDAVEKAKQMTAKLRCRCVVVAATIIPSEEDREIRSCRPNT